MTLIDELRQKRQAALDANRSPAYWIITASDFERLRSEAHPGEIGGSDYTGLYTFDGLPLRQIADGELSGTELVLNEVGADPLD